MVRCVAACRSTCVEVIFARPRKAHPALQVEGLTALVARCEAAGSHRRARRAACWHGSVHIADPFGNRIEPLVERGSTRSGQRRRRMTDGANRRPPSSVLCRRDDGVYLCLCPQARLSTGASRKGSSIPATLSEETALNEAWEEAGLRGQLVGEAIGTLSACVKFRSRLTVAGACGWKCTRKSATGSEARLRERRWHPLEEAMALLEGHPVHPLLGGTCDCGLSGDDDLRA